MPEEVARKVTGSNKEVAKVLWSAAAPERLEWLFNNLRIRHAMTPLQRALLPSGTASNEALHAEINAWTRSNRMLHQSTLRLKLGIMQFGKLLAHHIAACFPTLQQCSESVLLARCLSSDVWDDATWASWCRGIQKAPVPLHRARTKEKEQVRAWKAAQPQRDRKPTARKPTVRTLKRQCSVRSCGVRQ